MNTTLSKDLQLEWSEKNGFLELSDFSESSAKKAWWQCQKDNRHIWQARIFSRRKGAGCPYCNSKKFLKEDSFGFKFPQLLVEWNYEKNVGLDPYLVSPKSGKKVWWRCANGHEWQVFIRHRTFGGRNNKGTNCPYCSNQKCCEDNSLTNKFKWLLKEWDYNKNSITPDEIVFGSRKKIWWKCQKASDHEWQSSVYNRTKLEAKCPCCDGHKVVKSTCLATTHPAICKEWNYEKNDLTPFDFTYASNKKAWWKCELAHEWYCKIYTRTRGDQCPICASSKGEKSVREFIENNNIIYENEYRFKDCKDKRSLPFDFALFENGLFALIEYQGIHHYEPIKYFGGIKRFKETVLRDKIKFDYCKKNNIPLLIIPYWELKNIDSILNDFLPKFKNPNNYIAKNEV
jgi:DNA-directed RNA polymerase subunit RPC12/RpoP